MRKTKKGNDIKWVYEYKPVIKLDKNMIIEPLHMDEFKLLWDNKLNGKG